MKRSISILLALMLILSLCACGKKGDDTSSIVTPVSSEEEPVKQLITNPLTGEETTNAALRTKRPVAVMINNISVAQSVQAGLSKADIVYELLAEGGITRFMAVFSDISGLSKVGTIRSARYSYVDLALGHDALYVHAGEDPTECAAHIAQTGIDDFNLLDGAQSKYGKRIANGKAREHTLYTTGELITSGFQKLNYRTDRKSSAADWQAFVKPGEQTTPTGGSCEKISVEMSSTYVSNFTYDASTGKYKRFSGSRASVDFNTGAQLSFKNILVLKTRITDIGKKADYLKKTWMDSGEGYYVSNGAYVPIKWSKGNPTAPLKITLADGSTCAYNTGNTWVCFVEQTHSVKITGAPTATSSTTGN